LAWNGTFRDARCWSRPLALFSSLPRAERFHVRARAFSAPLEALVDRVPTGATVADVGCGMGCSPGCWRWRTPAAPCTAWSSGFAQGDVGLAGGRAGSPTSAPR
jgi:hypothetical protein